jgi:nitrilase
MTRFLIAAAQVAPVFMDRDATIEKACMCTAEAGSHGARLLVFPETFVPGYPCWTWIVPPKENRMLAGLYAELVSESIDVPGPETEKLCDAARRAGVFIVVGVNERNTGSSGSSLYNTILYIDEKGTLLGKHRKLVPTAPERMVWSQGDGSTLDVYESSLGKIGGLICWENYMPLARYAMYAWGTQIYVAPTWDTGEPWLSTLRHIAKEGRVYVVGCSGAIRLADIPDRYEFKNLYAQDDEWVNVGDSAIVNPDGKIIAGPSNRKEEILYAEIDSAQMTGPRWKLDVAGHYGRPDVFQLTVNRRSSPFISEEGP